ncbi:hypothetical protein Cmtc_17390 [Cupriavidus sp. TKC]|uniref:hypothetical protein n=1 Tax=Cupriavidus sp. TKC TaxID=2880159 RepID=UPI0025A89CE3|nr:hypothetical protein [Cupriavidus sp. TKC]GMG90519.1 hypothetical protein Cmtc_17390 [Cupriavidus sp. TKC]
MQLGLAVDVEQFAGLVPVPAPLMIVGMDDVREKIGEILGEAATPDVMERLFPLALMLRAKAGAINQILQTWRQKGSRQASDPGTDEIRSLVAGGILSEDEVPALSLDGGVLQLRPGRSRCSE